MTTRLRDWGHVPITAGTGQFTVWGVVCWHLKFWVTPILITFALYFGALGWAKQYALTGDFVGIGKVMIGMIIILLLIGYALGLVGIHYAYHYWRGQVGGPEENKEKGLSIADGMREIEKNKSAHKNFVHAVITYACIPFLVLAALAWFGPKFVTEYGPVLLFLSFPAVIVVTWLNPGKFVAHLTKWVIIGIIVLVVAKALWVGANAKWALSQSEAAASAPADTRAANEAAQAKLEYLQNQAAKCSRELAAAWRAGMPPTIEAQAACDKKQQAVQAATGSVPGWMEIASNSALAVKTHLSQDTKGSSPATAAGAINAPAVDTTSGGLTSWTGFYEPFKGRTVIGEFKPGQYRLVELPRTAEQAERVQVTYDLELRPSEHRLDKDGRFVDLGGRVHNYTPPNGESMPFPSRPYGAVIGTVDGKEEWVARGRCFGNATKQFVFGLDANLLEFEKDRKGRGGHHLRVEKC